MTKRLAAGVYEVEGMFDEEGEMYEGVVMDDMQVEQGEVVAVVE